MSPPPSNLSPLLFLSTSVSIALSASVSLRGCLKQGMVNNIQAQRWEWGLSPARGALSSALAAQSESVECQAMTVEKQPNESLHGEGEV